MLLEQRTLNDIDQAVERNFLDLMIAIVGYDILSDEDKQRAATLGLVQINRPLIESLYLIARSRASNADKRSVSLRDLIAAANLSSVMPITSDTQAYSVEHAKREMYEALLNAKEDLKKRTRQAVLHVNDTHQKMEVANKKPSKEESARRLLIMIGGLLETVSSSFTRAATVSVTNLVNNAVMDQALMSGSILGVKADQIRVYKVVKNDGRLCNWCSSFYQDKNGNPKIYTLAELAANGTNDGEPKSNWKPVVGSTHPRCRCQLHFLLPGENPPKK
jgi:hypothetical protein